MQLYVGGVDGSVVAHPYGGQSPVATVVATIGSHLIGIEAFGRNVLINIGKGGSTSSGAKLLDDFGVALDDHLVDAGEGIALYVGGRNGKLQGCFQLSVGVGSGGKVGRSHWCHQQGISSYGDAVEIEHTVVGLRGNIVEAYKVVAFNGWSDNIGVSDIL